ncbi:phosphopantetheine adenylyltransferase [Alicyclobacillus cellulosilyticus]|uniref:Phosphopantetheine adenylyltransferase n=1 Tax=Alicyclobacillus cellulosilyticus TaxID=1003997 RepID=A0A917KEF6_9BACL|nr:pantetheine-phosphate adenylyltransferase [Alicyclobacillus cellulosilyticus]GGJ08069.1 phosphopantetheine adenylyltransferase [Alicyclobacillus cellulosilyticus]
MTEPRVGIYPGSFDPVTNGHLDVLRRACRLFDRVVVAVLQNPAKTPLFTREERLALLAESTKELPNVSVESFDGLLVELAARHRACAVIRGVRAAGDLESELRMAQMNRRLYEDAVTILVPTDPAYAFVSSTLVKEVALFGGDVSGLVPPPVARALAQKRARREGVV